MKKCMITSPINFDSSQVSLLDLLPNHIHISPLVVVDFSLANLTFNSSNICEHTNNVTKPNQYRDLLLSICRSMYTSELFVPVFGCGAKTFPGSSTTTNIFPMSMNMSNPLIPNDEEILLEQYCGCLSQITLDLPVKLSPMMLFLKSMAQSVRDKQEKKNATGESFIRFPQVFYQVFVLMTGIIEDIEELMKVFECSLWACLPI